MARVLFYQFAYANKEIFSVYSVLRKRKLPFLIFYYEEIERKKFRICPECPLGI
jgi:hypothetical protein